MTALTLDENASEYSAARSWRLRHGMTMAQLAQLIGWSPSSIVWMERGRSSDGGPLHPRAWHRYKMSCMAADSFLKEKRQFNW